MNSENETKVFINHCIGHKNNVAEIQKALMGIKRFLNHGD
jgi:hypothetical protein